MSSERNIPYEDEVSPGPSRQATINNNNNTKDGGDGSSSGGESGDGKDGGSGSSSRNTPTRNKNNVRQLMTRLRRTLLGKSDGPSES